MIEDKQPTRWERRRRQREDRRHGDGAPPRLARQMKDFLGRYRPVIRALLIYAASLAGLLFLYALLSKSQTLDPLLWYNAQATGFLVGLFGTSVEVSGSLVVSHSFAIRIIEECTALAPIAIFTAAVLAYPADLSRKLIGMAGGIAILVGINLVRTTSLFYVGLAFPEALEVVHLLVWQSVMVIASVALWLGWMRRYAH